MHRLPDGAVLGIADCLGQHVLSFVCRRFGRLLALRYLQVCTASDHAVLEAGDRLRHLRCSLRNQRLQLCDVVFWKPSCRSVSNSAV